MSLAHPLNSVFTSPTLYEHRRQTAPAPEDRVFVIRDGAGRTVGVCPIVFWKVSIPFQVRKRRLGSIELKAATVSGGEPLVSSETRRSSACSSTGFWITFPGAIASSFPRCPLKASPPGFSTHARIASRKCFVDPRRLEPREWIYLELEPGDSLASFLEGKQKRTRNTLKRRVRKLREHGAGALECQRVEREDEIDAFYAAGPFRGGTVVAVSQPGPVPGRDSTLPRQPEEPRQTGMPACLFAQMRRTALRLRHRLPARRCSSIRANCVRGRLWRILTGNGLVLSHARRSLPAPAAEPRESRRGGYAPQAALHEPEYLRHHGLPLSPHDAGTGFGG